MREDPKNPNLLYAGTEFGLFVSIDGGGAWEKFMNGYPTVRTDDILVHPRDGDLIVASHGRSIWIADDITPLQQWTPQMEAAEAVLFDVRPAVAYKNDMRLNIATGGEQEFEGENPAPGTAIHFYVNRFVSGDASISVMEPGGRPLCESTVTTTPGELHRLQWTLAATPPSQEAEAADNPPRVGSCTGGGGGRGGGSSRAAPGTYVVKLTVGGKEYTKPVRVLEDIWMHSVNPGGLPYSTIRIPIRSAAHITAGSAGVREMGSPNSIRFPVRAVNNTVVCQSPQKLDHHRSPQAPLSHACRASGWVFSRCRDAVRSGAMSSSLNTPGSQRSTRPDSNSGAMVTRTSANG